MPAFSAAVVGSGPNGLTAAIRLAQAGHRVVVYEGADQPGGGLRTAALTLPGYHHDTCSSVHPMGITSPYWRTLPLEQHGLEWLHPDVPVAHPLAGSDAVLLHRSVDETAAGLDPEDRAAYRDTFGPLADRWHDLAADTLAPLGLPGSPLLMARFGALAFQSAGGLARRRFRGPRARALFAGVAAHSVLPLDRTPSAAIGMMLQLAAHGVGWPLPRGGAQSVATALMGVLSDLGGEVRLSTPITALDQVETDGPILFDTGPVALTRIAGDRLPASYRRRVEAFRYGPGSFKVDWALSGPIPWADAAIARAGTVHLGGTLEALEISERAPWEGEVAERPYVLLVQHSVADPTRAPDGHHVAWAYVHVPPHDDRDLTHLIEDAVERAAPGFRGRVLARATTSARDLERLNPNYIGGDVNGGAADWDQLFTRPVWRLRPYRTPDPRLFLCSASTPPGGGVHGMCGWHAAQAALSLHPPPSPRTTSGSSPG